MNFQQTILPFHKVPNMLGMAAYDQEGDMIDTNLPISDNLSEELGAHFLGLIEECRAVGRTDNRFVLEYGLRLLVFAEHRKGASLFMLEDRSSLEALYITFEKVYGEKKLTPVSLSPIIEPLETVESSHEPKRRSTFVWLASGVAAAVTALAAIPALSTVASAETRSPDINVEAKKHTAMLLEAEMEEKKLMAEAKAKAEMKATLMAELKAEAEQKAMAEAKEKAKAMAEAKAMAAEKARAEEEARIAQEALAAEQMKAEKMAAEQAAAKKALAVKVALKKKAASKRKKSYSKKRKNYSCNR